MVADALHTLAFGWAIAFALIAAVRARSNVLALGFFLASWILLGAWAMVDTGSLGFGLRLALGVIAGAAGVLSAEYALGVRYGEVAG